MGGLLNEIKSYIAENNRNSNLNVFVKTRYNLQKIKKIERKNRENLSANMSHMVKIHKNRMLKMAEITKE